MASDIERWRFARADDGVVKRGAIGHESGRGENAAAVRFDNSFIDIRRETEIVGVDY